MGIVKKSLKNSVHYHWGENCNGWHLVKSNDLSIIQESMPPNTEEQLHYHNFSQQFFYILKGMATFVMKDKTIRVEAGEGLHIEARIKHQIKNNTSETLDFLVISQPTAQGDRSY